MIFECCAPVLHVQGTEFGKKLVPPRISIHLLPTLIFAINIDQARFELGYKFGLLILVAKVPNVDLGAAGSKMSIWQFFEPEDCFKTTLNCLQELVGLQIDDLDVAFIVTTDKTSILELCECADKRTLVGFQF